MKKISLFALSLVALATTVFGQAEYVIKNLAADLVNTPQYTVNPAAKQVRPGQWLTLEVAFDAVPDFANELVFNYYVAFKSDPTKVYVGRVHHVSIPKGRDLHSVAYISPRSLSRIMKGKLFNKSEIDNITVTITKPGMSAPISSKSLFPSAPDWWGTRQAEEGFVVNKNETPFAPLSWEYYEAIKPAGAR